MSRKRFSPVEVLVGTSEIFGIQQPEEGEGLPFRGYAPHPLWPGNSRIYGGSPVRAIGYEQKFFRGELDYVELLLEDGSRVPLHGPDKKLAQAVPELEKAWTT